MRTKKDTTAKTAEPTPNPLQEQVDNLTVDLKRAFNTNERLVARINELNETNSKQAQETQALKNVVTLAIERTRQKANAALAEYDVQMLEMARLTGNFDPTKPTRNMLDRDSYKAS